MRFEAAKDIWLKLVLLMVVCVTLAAVFVARVKAFDLLLVIPVIVIVFSSWLYFDSYYELKEKYLYCKIGPFQEKIYYDQIAWAKLSTNFLSSMALSTKRIEIRQKNKNYFFGTTMISPVDREKFLKLLIEKIPHDSK